MHAHGAEVVDVEFKPERGGVGPARRASSGRAHPSATCPPATRPSTSSSAPTCRATSALRSTSRTSSTTPTSSRSALPGSSGALRGRARLRPLRREQGEAQAARADGASPEGLGGQRVVIGTLDGVVERQGSRGRERPGARGAALAIVERARLVFEIRTSERGRSLEHEQHEALRRPWRYSSNSRARRSDPPPSDRDGREGQGHRQGAPRQDGRRGHPQGRPERLRPQPRARGPLQRGHRARSTSSST